MGWVALRQSVLLISRTWFRWRSHRARRTDNAAKTGKTLATKVRFGVWVRWRLTEWKWSSWPNQRSTWRSGVALWHSPYDLERMVAIVSTSLHVWAERAKIISLIVRMVWQHVAAWKYPSHAMYRW